MTYRGPLTSCLDLYVLHGALLRLVPCGDDQPKGRVAKAAKYLFGQTGLTWEGALIFFFTVFIIAFLWNYRGKEVQARNLTPAQTWTTVSAHPRVLVILYIAIGLPTVSGPFIAQVIVTVTLFILMGLGLNITLGFAGLLDLGFVAFYAIGAYTVGLLTSYGPFGLQHVSFWVAVPIAVLVAMSFGAILGLPVLGVRGDYLAIATLGLVKSFVCWQVQTSLPNILEVHRESLVSKSPVLELWRHLSEWMCHGHVTGLNWVP